MNKIKSVIKDLKDEKFSKEKIVYLLLENTEENLLFKEAYEIKERYVGKRVYLRGLIEFSNICKKNCYYCGIRKDNLNVLRYLMKQEEVLEASLFAYKNGFGSIVLQSGEREDKEFINYLEKIVKSIKHLTDNKLGITLSVGEQEEEVYRSFFKCGAHRYLLRIETSNKNIYEKIHPYDHSFERRLNCIKSLKKIGFQTGTGVMIGIPFQSVEDLADDIMFFVNLDADMIGMGPYIEHRDAPLSKIESSFPLTERFRLTLKMMAIVRIIMKDVNIASTTALDAIRSDGRDKGILAGANVIMPNITPLKYRENYKLYDNKPYFGDDEKEYLNSIIARIKRIGEEVGLNLLGDPIHYFRRKNNEK